MKNKIVNFIIELYHKIVNFIKAISCKIVKFKKIKQLFRISELLQNREGWNAADSEQRLSIL